MAPSTTENKILLKQGKDYTTIIELEIIVHKLLKLGYSMENIDTEPLSIGFYNE